MLLDKLLLSEEGKGDNQATVLVRGLMFILRSDKQEEEERQCSDGQRWYNAGEKNKCLVHPFLKHYSINFEAIRKQAHSHTNY